MRLLRKGYPYYYSNFNQIYFLSHYSGLKTDEKKRSVKKVLTSRVFH